MSNSDSFIEEVSEEVRRDRLYGALRKYGWIAALGVVVIVGGAAYNEWRKATAQTAAQAFGDALYFALEADDSQARLAALSTIDAPEGGETLISLIRAVEAQATAPEQSVAALQELLTSPGLESHYQDLARLQLAIVGNGVLSVSDRRAALDAIIQGSGPYRSLALEQRALIELETGQRDTAIETLRGLLEASDASQGLRSRALQMIVALGGDVAG